ncbi:MAG: hypothetical protein ACU0BO_03260 [Limimaricola soesokkakensis]|uniref:hypothetical protein n=1 Tax=Limimaricola soesokkakensis TaxID=1343159 RepID=UPI00405A30E0
MNKVVSAINSILPTPPKCVFYGSSAGGFWAMMMAALNTSECVVEIPQTDMFKYPWASHRELLLDHCYRDHGLDPEDYKHRLNVCDWFEYTGMAPTTIKYFQNSGDFNHTKLQLEPFQKRIAEMGYQGLDVTFYERPDAEDGHTVMHKVNSVVAIRHLLS